MSKYAKFIQNIDTKEPSSDLAWPQISLLHHKGCFKLSPYLGFLYEVARIDVQSMFFSQMIRFFFLC